MDRVLAYHFFLTPRLIYELAPFAVLTAVLVSFGILTKHNEVTALKACGVSVYRLAAPILVAGVVLSGALVRLRSLLGPGGRPAAGRAARGDQGPPRADLPAPGSPLDFRSPRPHVLLQVFRSGPARDAGRERV